jgi:hypothetical protein
MLKTNILKRSFSAVVNQLPTVHQSGHPISEIRVRALNVEGIAPGLSGIDGTILCGERTTVASLPNITCGVFYISQSSLG